LALIEVNDFIKASLYLLSLLNFLKPSICCLFDNKDNKCNYIVVYKQQYSNL